VNNRHIYDTYYDNGIEMRKNKIFHPQTHFLIGCVSLTHHISIQYKRSIYIIGEDHNAIYNINCNKNKNQKSQYVSDWLNTIIVDTSNNVDIFIETPHAGPSFQSTKFDEMKDIDVDFKNQILLIYEKFKNYLLSHKNINNRENIKFHYVDIRDYPDKNMEKFSIYYSEQISALSFGKKFLEYNDIDNIKDLVDYIRPILLYFTRVDCNQLDISSKAQKQVDKIGNSHLRNIINNYFETERSSYAINETEINSLLDEWLLWDENNVSEVPIYKIWTAEWQLQFGEDNNIKHILKNIERISNNILKLGALFMDKYLLGRLFNDNISSNIIIYAEDFHCETYRNVLNILGFKLNYKSHAKINEYEEVECLDITKLKYPLLEAEFRK
jgi:hypothetical protein